MNVLGMLNLADICFEKKIHLTTYATGCIFHYDKDFPEGSGKGFKESDKPNFTGSYYSYTKVSFSLRLRSALWYHMLAACTHVHMGGSGSSCYYTTAHARVHLRCTCLSLA